MLYAKFDKQNNAGVSRIDKKMNKEAALLYKSNALEL